MTDNLSKEFLFEKYFFYKDFYVLLIQKMDASFEYCPTRPPFSQIDDLTFHNIRDILWEQLMDIYEHLTNTTK